MKLYRLFTPGPIDVPPDVLAATGKPMLYHREERFAALVADITAMLRKIIRTRSRIYFFTSSGTGAMEAACVNLLSRSDRPVVAVCGKFGERWVELCRRYGIDAQVINEPFGRAVDPGRIEKALRNSPPGTVLFTTLTETSTGVLNDIKTIGGIAKRRGAYLVVDGVAGIGADYCPQDDWSIDVLVGASQKALMAPPGISFMSIADRAYEKSLKSDVPKYYFDLALYEKFARKDQTPWTPAITILYGLRQGLKKITAGGVAASFRKHEKIGAYVRQRIRRMGCDIFPEIPSNALSVIKMPAAIESTPIIKEIKEKHAILFSNGQGEMKGKILRIGHMGNYTVAKLKTVLDVLESAVNQRR